MTTANCLLIGVLLITISCSRTPEKDWNGRAGTVDSKSFTPAGPDFPARWILRLKDPEGKDLAFVCDETTFHKYEAGDSYP